jgi:transposase
MRKRKAMHVLQELVRLHRMRTGARKIARLLKMSPNTERSYREALDAAGLLDGPVEDLPEVEVLKAALPTQVPAQQESSIEDLVGEVRELLKKGSGPRAIHDHFKLSKKDYNGSYWAMKRLCKRLSKAQGVRPQDVAIPLETVAGEEAQVDFGYVGRQFDPEQQVLRKAWVFVMILAHSRHQFAKVVFDQSAVTWCRLHVEAFTFFGGVPATIVPDNLKAAVVRAAFGMTDDCALNRTYVELARHYGFKVDPTPARDPEKKGKVEAGVKYAKRNFFQPRPTGEDIAVVNRELTRWVNEIAGTRMHGTTGRQPLEVFEQEEKAVLKPLPALGWVPVIWKNAKVHRDCCVLFERRLYSVPWRYVGEEAWVKATPGSVTIYVDDQRVATHERQGTGGRSVNPDHMPEGRGELRHRGQEYWRRRASLLGEQVEAWVSERFATDDVLSPLRTIQAVVTMLEQYPRERASAACRRARHFGVQDYRGIKDILRKALDLQPLPDTLPAPVGTSAMPRFVRPVSQIILAHQEAHHDVN